MFSEFNCRVPSVHRRHGDPFPLPRLGQPTAAGLLSRRLDGAAGALNTLSGAFFKRTNSTDLKLTAVQKRMMSDLRRRISNHGERPPDMEDESALGELLQNANLYVQEASNVASFDSDEVKILSRKLDPIPAQEVASPSARMYLEHFESLVERPVQELEALRNSQTLVNPHWDIKLKTSLKARMQLYQKLHRCGLLTYRWREKARVGVFAVKKKGNKPGNTQRLIVDCRQGNALLRKPPTTRLSTPAGLTSVDFSQATFDDLGFNTETDSDFFPTLETGDVGDCFYNFLVPQACSWFSTGDTLDRQTMRAWGIEESVVYNEETRSNDPLPEDASVFVCFKGMPMGWSWALYLAQDIVCNQCLIALSGGEHQLIRDKHIAPALQPGQCPVGVYVDNVHTFGASRGEASKSMVKIAQRFSELGIPFEVDGVEGHERIDTLGLTFHFSNGVRVTAKAERAWRLWSATSAILRRRRVSGDVMRVWLGHVNFHFLLCRPLLSTLSASYKFSIAHLGHRFPMWSTVRKEMKLVQNLLLVVEKDLSAPYSGEVHVGDSSDRGYGLLSTHTSLDRVRAEMQFEERWRFIQSSEPLEIDGGFPHPEGVPEDDVTFRGSIPKAGVGGQTSYGQLLTDKLSDSKSCRRLKVRSKFLLGDSSPTTRSLIRIPGFSEISSTWSEEKQWNLIAAKAWKNVHEHINIKEAKVALMGLRRFCRTESNFGHRCLSLCDNQVAVFVFSKGRSGTSSLNNLCRRAAAYQVGCNIRWHVRYIASKDNPADGPSRQFGADLVKGPKIQDGSNFNSNSPHTLHLAFRHSAADSLDAHTSIDSFEQGQCTAEPRRPRRVEDSHGDKCFLELFAGTGNLTKSFRRRLLRVFPAFEWAKGQQFDLLHPTVQQFVFGLIMGQHVWMVHLGTPCTAWSRARHGIKNLQKARSKEQHAIATALFTCRVIRECLKRGVAFSLENPSSSRLWQFQPLLDIIADKRVFFVHFDMCMFGEPHRKSTSILTNEPALVELGRKCCGGHKHIQLQGSVRVKIDGVWKTANRTSLAGEYPVKLCDLWAQAVDRVCPPSGRGVVSWRRKNEFLSALQEAANTGQRTCVEAASGPHFKDGNPKKSEYKTLQEAIRFLRDHPVVFGQFTREDIQRQAALYSRHKTKEAIY